MDLGITGRAALVTAASKGLGLATAHALAEEGARVTICARGEEALQAAERQLQATGAEVQAIVADVTAPDAPARLVAATVERFGAIDIVVPNAGGPPHGGAFDVDDEALERALNANLLTSIRLVREAVPHMRSRGWGRVCCITSAAVKQPMPGLTLSNTARTALWAWAKTAATDVFGDGITVNLACPGTHLTDRIRELGGPPPGTPVGDAADFGKVVAFLCSEPANFVSGVALQVDGARTLGLL